MPQTPTPAQECPALRVMSGTLGFATDKLGQPILDQPLVPQHRYSRVVDIAPGGTGDGLTSVQPIYLAADRCAHCGASNPKDH